MTEFVLFHAVAAVVVYFFVSATLLLYVAARRRGLLYPDEIQGARGIGLIAGFLYMAAALALARM